MLIIDKMLLSDKNKDLGVNSLTLFKILFVFLEKAFWFLLLILPNNLRNTVFNLITQNTYKRRAKQFRSLEITYSQCTFCLFLFKCICCGHQFELHGRVDAIQMSYHNIRFIKKIKKKSHKHHQISPLIIYT